MNRAQNASEDFFVRFFMLWTSFNAWMSCITEADSDADMLRDLGRDKRLNQFFTQIMQENRKFSDRVEQFAMMWPVFNVHSITQKFGPNHVYTFETRNQLLASIIKDKEIWRRPRVIGPH
jgi:hypothetical protein